MDFIISNIILVIGVSLLLYGLHQAKKGIFFNTIVMLGFFIIFSPAQAKEPYSVKQIESLITLQKVRLVPALISEFYESNKTYKAFYVKKQKQINHRFDEDLLYYHYFRKEGNQYSIHYNWIKRNCMVHTNSVRNLERLHTCQKSQKICGINFKIQSEIESCMKTTPACQDISYETKGFVLKLDICNKAYGRPLSTSKK